MSAELKFTPEGGRIQISAAIDGPDIRVSVRDTGVGIAKEDQARIFEEFQQTKHGRQQAESTGLGLTLSKRFVELHGGRIWVDSEPGHGTTFSFTIPQAVVTATIASTQYQTSGRTIATGDADRPARRSSR